MQCSGFETTLDSAHVAAARRRQKGSNTGERYSQVAVAGQPSSTSAIPAAHLPHTDETRPTLWRPALHIRRVVGNKSGTLRDTKPTEWLWWNLWLSHWWVAWWTCCVAVVVVVVGVVVAVVLVVVEVVVVVVVVVVVLVVVVCGCCCCCCCCCCCGCCCCCCCCCVAEMLFFSNDLTANPPKSVAAPPIQCRCPFLQMHINCSCLPLTGARVFLVAGLNNLRENASLTTGPTLGLEHCVSQVSHIMLNN